MMMQSFTYLRNNYITLHYQEFSVHFTLEWQPLWSITAQMVTTTVSSLTLPPLLLTTTDKLCLLVLFLIGVQSKGVAFLHLNNTNDCVIDIWHSQKISMVLAAIEHKPSQITYVRLWVVIGYGITMASMIMLWC